MIPTPTDRLHKLAALGGLALALAGTGAAIHQYNATAIQGADLYEEVLRGVNSYNRYAEVARRRILVAEELKKAELSEDRRIVLNEEFRLLGERLQPLDSQVQEALVKSQKQAALHQHNSRMQAFWFAVAAICLVAGAFISYKGFRFWLALPPDAR